MRLTFLVFAFSAVFHSSAATLTELEKFKAYFESQSNSIDEILSYLESVAENVVDVLVNVKPSDVKLYYYNQSSIDQPITSFTLADTTNFDSVFNRSKESFYIAHGYVSDYSSNINTVIRRAVLSKHDVNLLVLNWWSYTGYVYAYDSVPYVGTYLGQFISNVSAKYNYSNCNVRMAGHSLGAHICGIAGQVCKRSIRSIVGLDPAGPLYRIDNSTDIRLSPDDAQHVQAIHTNKDLYGIDYSVGRSDFYPNGGGTQPNCTLIEDFAFCSHKRAFQYFAESILTGGFEAIKCRIPSNSTGTSSYCCNPFNTVYMGQYTLDKRARGDYFLTTNGESPYAQGTKGLNDTSTI